MFSLDLSLLEKQKAPMLPPRLVADRESAVHAVNMVLIAGKVNRYCTKTHNKALKPRTGNPQLLLNFVVNLKLCYLLIFSELPAS